MTTDSTRYRDALNALEQTLQTMKKFENEGYADDYFAAFHFLDTHGEAIRESLTIAEAVQQEPSAAVEAAGMLPLIRHEAGDRPWLEDGSSSDKSIAWAVFKVMIAQLLKEVKDA